MIEQLWENYGNDHFHIGLFSIVFCYFTIWFIIFQGFIIFILGKNHMIKYDCRIDHRYENIWEQHI